MSSVRKAWIAKSKDYSEVKEDLEEPEEELEEMPEKVNLPQVRIWGGTEEYLSPLCQTEGTLLSKGDAVGLTSTVKLASEVQAPWQKGRSWAS